MKASVSTFGLFVLAGVGLMLIVFDFRLAGEKARVRHVIAVVAFLLACSSLANLAWTAVGELRHPPKAPAARSDMPFGGPPPGFAPPAFDPAGPDNPADIPEKLRAQFDQIQQFIRKTLEVGGDPGSVWSPEDHMRFRRLVEEGKIDEAEALLNRAVQRMK